MESVLWSENWEEPCICTLHGALFAASLCSSTCHWHVYVNGRDCSSRCFQGHIRAHLTLLFHSLSLYVFVLLFEAVLSHFFFPLLHALSPSHPSSGAVSPFLSLPLTLCLSVIDSQLTVKPFHGLWVWKHQKLSCQMLRGREERNLFTVNQKTKA